MLEIGSLVDGKYRILRVVGKGGMSVVYQAVNEKANKIWAIKEVRKDGVQNFEVVKQNLIVETELLKRFNHPNLPSIIDVIDGDGTFLIVMDYIEGNSLSKALESGAQSQEDVIEWSKQLCDVLGYLHSRKPPIIYRDMKPANVMLKPDGNVSLIDFGTAREFKSSSVEDTTCLGTQGYAAPEQYGGHGQTDARTDIYCLGATMYHLVTGHNPSTPPYEMYPIRQWNPMLSSGLEEIILKCTQRNPEDRYQSCAELLYALDHYQDLDIESKRRQSFKWKVFLASVIATVVMLISTIGLSIASANVVSGTYSSLITQADNLYSENSDLKPGDADYNEAKDLYKRAVKVDSGKIDAFLHLLNLYLNDSKISDVEFNDLQTSVYEHESELISNDKDRYYDEFAITFADACFFSYEGRSDTNDTRGRSNSGKWYAKVMNYENSKYKNKATVLHFLAINENKLKDGEIDANGNTKVSVAEYWENIEKLIDPQTLQTTNLKIQLSANRFAINFMYNNTSLWRQYGISSDRYFAAVNKVKENLNNLKQDPLFIAVSNRYSQGKTASAGSENNNINLQDKIIYEMAQDIEELINSAYVDNFGSPNTTAEQEVRNN